MKTRGLEFLILSAALAAAPAAALQPEMTQSFQLHPGWNAVYLEVRPSDNSAEAVFGGLPLASAWTWNPSVGKVQFIDNPSEQLTGSPAWLGYFPRPRPESILTNLFSVQANRAYLLKIDGDQPVTWTVTGVPEVQAKQWVPDSFNLVGFTVDPAQPPTFGQFLAPSPAHAGQPIYRLNDAGAWEAVASPFATAIHSGSAYWVFSKGPSSYTGPIDVSLDASRTLDFGGSLDQLRLRVRNLAAEPVAVSLTQIGGATPTKLSYFKFDPDTGELAWPALPPSILLPTQDGGEALVDLAPRRAEFTAAETASILEIKSVTGFRRYVAVSAKGPFAPPAFLEQRAERAARAARAAGLPAPIELDSPIVFPLAGLWVGEVSVRKVSQAQTGSIVPVPVGADFRFRVMIHVDQSGTPRLLKEVIELWKNGTEIPDPENPGATIVDEPGHYVLITDEGLVSNFEGAALRDGQPVGYRVSTINYDFDGQSVLMTGAFGTNGSLSVTLTEDSDAATNPFKHKYHPDHNNLDEQYLGHVEEAYTVTRNTSFEFAATDPFGRELANYGSSVLGGTFTETLSGLHRNDIAVEGTFLLNRVSTRPVLNQ